MPLSLIAEIPSPMPQFAGMMANASLAGQPQLMQANFIQAGFTQSSFMQAKKAARFPRTSRLLRHADFQRVYKQGRRHFSANMTVFYLARPEDDATRMKMPAQQSPTPNGLRVGFTVGRVLGGAVQRNRMKRRLREAVRLMLPADQVSADVVINPKKSLLTADFAGIVNEVSRAFVVIQQKAQKSSEKSSADSGSRKPEAGSQP